MRVVPCVCLLAGCFGLAGCASVFKKSKPAPTASVPSGGGSPGTPFWADPADAPRSPTASVPGPGALGDPVSRPGNDPEVSGVLAGRLVDSFGRSPTGAYIQVTKVGDPPGSGVDVEVVNQGYFYIPGLQPGRTYRLVARTKQDGRVLVGEVQARPPETRLLIPLSEDLAGASTPPLPGAPQPPVPRGRSGSSVRPVGPASKSPPPDAPWGTGPAVELGPPASGGPAFGPVSHPEQVATTPGAAPPRANIPTPVPPPGLPSTAPVQPQSFHNATPPPVTTASCLVANGRLQYLSLPDPDGRMWDFAQHRGRLVLLDFWGSWCGPCLRAIPELSRLQSSYRDRGLEVVGIACERGEAADNARRVRDVRQRITSINYRLVLADPPGRDPVQAQFRIAQYPTLVLLDGDGTILWRGDPQHLRELESILNRRLGY